MDTDHVYTAHISPSLNGLERFKSSNVIEIRNSIMFNFYPGLPHILHIFIHIYTYISAHNVCIGWLSGGVVQKHCWSGKNTYLCRMHQSLSEDEDHGLHCPQPHLYLTMEESLQHWHQEGLRYVATHTTKKERSAVYTCTHIYATVLVYITLV